MRCLLGLLLLVAFDLEAQILFTDNFDGTEIDSTKWDIFLPFSDSSVYVQNGVLKSKNYGLIVSKQSFYNPSQISMVIGLLNSPGILLRGNDQFILRQSGLTPEILSQANNSLTNGFVVMFGSPAIIPGQVPYEGAETDNPYIFNDYGSLLTISGPIVNPDNSVTYEESNLWPNPEFWPDNIYLTGAKIGFFGSDTNIEASLFSVRVSVPEPTALSLLAVGLGVVLRQRRRTV